MDFNPAVFTATMTQRDESIHASLDHAFPHHMVHA